MNWFAAYAPHGAKCHATPTPPDLSDAGFSRGRVALCGRAVYTKGPPYFFDSPRAGTDHDRCARCQDRIDKTREKAP